MAASFQTQEENVGRIQAKKKEMGGKMETSVL